MARGESVTSYLTIVFEVRDELETVGETIEGLELVRTTLVDFLKKWEVFIDGIIARENMPS